ncbi:MAG: hypothetical protein ACN23H_02420 [Candidatus Phytoplasma vitis]|nr:MAG: hypothetical protein M6G77_01670 [Candidatus Phytoplasma vitis]
MFYKFYKVKNDSQQDIEPLPHSYSEPEIQNTIISSRFEKEIEPEKKKDIKQDKEPLPESYSEPEMQNTIISSRSEQVFLSDEIEKDLPIFITKMDDVINMFQKNLNDSGSKIKEITDKCTSLESQKNKLTKDIESKTEEIKKIKPGQNKDKLKNEIILMIKKKLDENCHKLCLSRRELLDYQNKSSSLEKDIKYYKELKKELEILEKICK